MKTGLSADNLRKAAADQKVGREEAPENFPPRKYSSERFTPIDHSYFCVCVCLCMLEV